MRLQTFFTLSRKAQTSSCRENEWSEDWRYKCFFMTQAARQPRWVAARLGPMQALGYLREAESEAGKQWY